MRITDRPMDRTYTDCQQRRRGFIPRGYLVETPGEYAERVQIERKHDTEVFADPAWVQHNGMGVSDANT